MSSAGIIAPHGHGRMTGGAWLLAAALLAEVLGWVALRSDNQRGTVVAAVLAGGIAVLLVRMATGQAITLPRLRPAHVAVLIGVSMIGWIGLTLALVGGNRGYYIAADLYHWYVEGVLAALAAVVVFGAGSARDAARAVAMIGLLVGAACAATFALGSMRLIEGGSHYVNNLGIARLIVGRGTPQIMLILVAAAWWRRARWDDVTRTLLNAALPLLLLALAVTLKRTLWLSLPIALACVVLPRRWLMIAVLAALILGPAAVTTALLLPESLDRLLRGASEVLTYNPAFTLEETLARRSKQLSSVWPYIAEHPYGHGLGASVYAYWSRGQTYAQVHYIHNLYAYYALQLGLAPLLVTGLLTGWLGWTWLRQDDRAGDWGFAVRGGLGCLAAMLANGVSLVPTHTLFAGFALGLGMVGSAKLYQRERERAR